jgi:hydroxymethylglutaryl-CoA lyase
MNSMTTIPALEANCTVWRTREVSDDVVRITETFLRDGAQAMPAAALAYLTVDRKIDVIERLCDVGIADIEVASFVHPRVLPQFSDAEEILRRLPAGVGTTFRAVTPNLRGLARAVSAGAAGRVTMIGMLACSEEYQRRNVGMSVEEGLAGLAGMLDYAQAEGVRLIAGVGVAFECPYEGAVDPDRVLSIVGTLVDIGFQEMWLGDTFGMASAPQVFEMMTGLKARWPEHDFGLHLHNRHGLALANILAALDAGIRMFDTSMLGIGAGSVIPGNRTEMGNVATEEVAFLCESLGFSTGVNTDEFRRLALDLATNVGLDVRSRVLRTGMPRTARIPQPPLVPTDDPCST